MILLYDNIPNGPQVSFLRIRRAASEFPFYCYLNLIFSSKPILITISPPRSPLPPFSPPPSPPTLRQLKPPLPPNLPHLPLIRLRLLGLLPRLLQAAKAKLLARLRGRLQNNALALVVAEDVAVDPFALVDEVAAGVQEVVPCAHCEMVCGTVLFFGGL